MIMANHASRDNPMLCHNESQCMSNYGAMKKIYMLASWLPKGLSFTASTSPTADLQDLGKFIFGDHTISVGIEDPEGSPHDFTPGGGRLLR